MTIESSLFSGMNVNHREMEQHIEFEPTTYYAAFSAELEASASPMWALVSHLRDASTAHLTKNLLRHCRAELQDWLKAINYEEGHDFNLHPHVSPKSLKMSFLRQ
jgi:E3 ubiquitin-protein ligase UBR3